MTSPVLPRGLPPAIREILDWSSVFGGYHLRFNPTKPQKSNFSLTFPRPGGDLALPPEGAFPGNRRLGPTHGTPGVPQNGGKQLFFDTFCNPDPKSGLTPPWNPLTGPLRLVGS